MLTVVPLSIVSVKRRVRVEPGHVIRYCRAPWGSQRQLIVSRHAVQGFSEIGGSLEDYFFGELFRIAGMAWNELMKPLKSVIDGWLV